ncbi:S-layer homology domain-containing protein [Candidatus Margulisiibacteriota bacterium]
MRWGVAFLLCFWCSLLASAALPPQYTNLKQMSFSGQIKPDTDAIVLNNNRRLAILTSDPYGNWELKDVVLTEGENLIQIRQAEIFGTTSIKDVAVVIKDTSPPQLYADISPRSAKAGQTLTLAVDANEKLKSVEAVMPNGQKTQLTYNSWLGKWEGLWKATDDIPNNEYRAVIIASDMAGNKNRKETAPFSLWTSPALVVDLPTPNLITYADYVSVRGTAKDVSTVEVNGKEVAVDDNGVFSARVKLRQGKQTLFFKAVNFKNKRITVVQRNVLKLLTYSDLKGYPGKKQAEYLATLGIMGPLRDSGLFAPQQVINRTDLAVLLIKLIKSPLVKLRKKTSFADVPVSFWAAPYIETATLRGFLKGYPGNNFYPARTINRAEAIALIIRLSGLPVKTSRKQLALDVGANFWAAPYIQAAISNKILPESWTASQKMFPFRPITRGEIAYMLTSVPIVKDDITTMLSKRNEVISDVLDADEKSPGVSKEIVINKVVSLPASKAEKAGAQRIEEVRPQILSLTPKTTEFKDSAPLIQKQPQVTLFSLPDKLVSYTPVLTIKGEAQDCDTLYINGNRIVLAGENGKKTFVSRLDLLAPGKNTIIIAAENNNGKRVVLYRRAILLNRYKDVSPQHWARKTIGALTYLGYLVPTPNYTFKPRGAVSGAEVEKYLQIKLKDIVDPRLPVSRGQMIVAICRAENLSVPQKASRQLFKDININDPLAPYVEVALLQGFISMTDFFYPDRPVLRATTAALLAKTSKVRLALQKLYNWNTGYNQDVEILLPNAQDSGIARDDLTVSFNVKPGQVTYGDNIYINIRVIEKVENVLITMPDQILRQMTGKSGQWSLLWQVPAQNLAPGAYRPEVIIIRADGSVVRKQAPEIVIK